MPPSASTLVTCAILASMIQPTAAHMALWHPSQYGFMEPYNPVFPLWGKSFNEWWFHGYASDKPAEVMNIIAGQPLTVEISCHKRYTIYGRETTTDSCPHDSGAYHAGGTTNNKTGWTGNIEAELFGCALAIAPTMDAASTRPEDFVVMSVLANCVRRRDTTFAIPANLPLCPGGECTCAWFWQGKHSREEMYMTGFRCNVIGGVATPFPTPLPPKRLAISGPVQPQYWANDISNIGYTPTYNTRPTYDRRWGWTDGAQTAAFAVEEPPVASTTAVPPRASGLPNAIGRRTRSARRHDYAAIVSEANASASAAAAARASATHGDVEAVAVAGLADEGGAGDHVVEAVLVPKARSRAHSRRAVNGHEEAEKDIALMV